MSNNIAVHNVEFDEFKSTMVYLGDRVMVSGDLGHQVFFGDFKSLREFAEFFQKASEKEKYEIAQLHKEGVVNKDRAISNVMLLPLEGYKKQSLIEKIKTCDCSPSTMRKKLAYFFNLLPEEINLLQLEDLSDEMVSTLEITYDHTKLILAKGSYE